MHSTPPGWIPHGNPSVDPNVNLTLDDITDDQEVKQEYIEAVKEQLKTVYDPEISVDLYTLGLIYDVKITSERYVFVLMSLTSAFCPAADSMPREIQQKIESIPGLKCKVRITMTPQWTREMIEPDMRSLMGL
jgi:metal-sulfur cluster biosynthetic enzyme|tara:strand:- start:358 stop:756 length:399 start_codon:yes stop_codon:yes gene_type:complete